MRILQVISSVRDECGGPTISAKNLAQMLAAKGYNVSICGTNNKIDNVQEESIDGYTLHEFPIKKPYRYYYSPQMGAFLKKHIRDYDIVHIHGLWLYPTFIASKICRKYNIPYIIRTCGMLELWSMSQRRIKKIFYFHLIEKHNLQMASFVQFSTEVEFKKSFHKKLDSQKLKYIPNILNVNEISSADICLNSPLIDKKYILFFGRLCYQKGLDVLIEAYNLLQEEPSYNDIYLVLMGAENDGYLKKLKKKRFDFQIWDKIIHMDMVHGPERFKIVKHALFLCLPSRQENLGLAILETLALGVPVIISRAVDIADYIEKRHLGRVSRIDSKQLYAFMKEMIDSDKERIEMGEGGRRFIYDRFDRNSIFRKYVDMYKETLFIKNKGGIL